MERLSSAGVFLLIIASLQGLLAINVVVFPTQSIVSAGQNVSMLCTVQPPTQIQYCRIEIPGMANPLNLSPSKPEYYGDGLDKGHCGVKIARVEDKNNGIFKCSMGIEAETEESHGTMKVTVARRPTQFPVMVLSKPKDSLDVYKENETITATCEVRDVRPKANITWFMGDEMVVEGVAVPVVIENQKDKDLYTVRQDLTRVLKWTDDNKTLKCVVSLPLIDNITAKEEKTIKVKYAPRPAGPVELFGFNEGYAGFVNVTVMANPKPDIFIWTVNDEDIIVDSTGHYQVVEPEIPNPSPGKWVTALRIATVTKEDVEREYKLMARNSVGSQTYSIRISTKTQPRDMAQMGAGAIVGIVIAVLLVLLIIFIVVFARATGRWCFAGGAASLRTGETGGDPEDPGKTEEAKRLTPKSRISTSVNSEQLLGQSSDTESADQGPAQKKNIKKKTKIPLTSMFKKAKDKVAGDSEILKSAVVAEEKDVEKADQQASHDVEQGKECVYAELTHGQAAERARPVVVVRPEDDKTEYAEIVHTKDEKKPDK